ncbi:hypothetical protein H0I23_00515 [Cellulophaga sp. HaHaR_3_176]|uniref:hypothetical protein n=1 Tax=Cellulophaga sp. HaHaR_3_176 TaxID=1942464 RepID=UPI001C1FA9DD|nr:hypothetical protein [Cellulophaga sp. HaHaR_3_176]QWX84166.1 hypothetical protein H0I23_00515 [Cellulophaga sp. HaHaR_3_176]
MRKSNLLVLCFLAAGIFSCSKDGEATISGEIDPDGVNLTEDELIDVNEASAAITVYGATEKTGDLVPNGAIAFNLDYSTQTAFQKTGFEIAFEAPADFAGAYIQLKDDNGMADTYFDVPANTMSTDSRKLINKGRQNFLSKKTSLTKKDENTYIDVDFSSAVPAGTFCYVICLYDGQGNISLPQEVCVKVEAWGGNTSLVADWGYTKQVENGETYLTGEAKCYDEGTSTLACDNGENTEIELSYCWTVNDITMNLKNDGTFVLNQNTIESGLDWEASRASCSNVEESFSSFDVSKGNWAYNEEKNELTLVEFVYTSTYEDGETETYESEDGELIFNGVIELTSSQLVVNEVFEDENGIEEYEYHFNKK